MHCVDHLSVGAMMVPGLIRTLPKQLDSGFNYRIQDLFNALPTLQTSLVIAFVKELDSYSLVHLTLIGTTQKPEQVVSWQFTELGERFASRFIEGSMLWAN